MARRHPGIQPVQVQLVSRQRRPAVVAAVDRRCRRRSRAPQKPAASRICRRCSHSSRSSTPRSAPPPSCTRSSIIADERIGARALRHQPLVGTGTVHRPGRCDAPVAAHRCVAAAVPAHARDQCRSQSLDVVETSIAPGATSVATRPLGLAWPRDVFSLSHVALPFPLSNPVYGREENTAPPQVIRLGMLSPRGERAVLSVPSDTLARLTCNPFFPYMGGRIDAWVVAK